MNVATVTWSPMNTQRGFSFALLNDSYAAGCGSLCIGGVFLIPFALKYGRRPIYVFSLAIQCGLAVWAAKMQNVTDLMLVNILSCIVGALSEVLVQMTVADVYFVHERGLMNTIYYWFMNFGTTLAPLAGGFITLSQGWRWVWWWMAILFGAGFIAFLLFYEETMFCARPIDGVEIEEKLAPQAPIEKHDGEVPESKKSHHVSDEIQHSAPSPIDPSIPKKRYWQKLALWTNSPMPMGQLVKHSYRPFLILFTIPAIFFMALEYGIMTACTTVPVTTLSSVMTLPPYNFGSAQIGLMGIPPFVGTSLGTTLCGPLSDFVALFLAKRNNGIFEPEMRLWLCLVFTPFVPAGLFMFGIGLDHGSHWLLPAFGLGVSAFGIVPASSAALTYLTDAYTEVRIFHPCSTRRKEREDYTDDMPDHRRLGGRSHVHSELDLDAVRLCAPTLDGPRWTDMVLRNLWSHRHRDPHGESVLCVLGKETPRQGGSQIPILERDGTGHPLRHTKRVMETSHEDPLR